MQDSKTKQLILLASSNTYRSKAFDDAAKKLGIRIIYGEDVPLPLMAANSRNLALDYRDIKRSTKKIVNYAKQHQIDAILGLDDSGTMIAASASEELNLLHNSIDSSLAARDKHIMRQCFEQHDVPSPTFEHHVITENIEELSNSVNYPCVIKPTTLSGSRGVMRANNPEEFVERIDRLRPILTKERCSEFLVEDYIPGVEVAIEGLLDNGNLIVLALFDKPDPLEGPFFEETIYVTPSRLPETAQTSIINTTEIAAKAIGLVQGSIHAELRYNDDGPWMVEIAGRSIGGLCSQTLNFETNVSLEELILRQITGMDLSNAKRSKGADGVMMIPIPEKGILKNISGVENAKKIPFITDIEISARIHYPISPLPEGDAYLGFIFATADIPEQVEQALRAAHAELHFDIQPEIELKSI